ncbi:MAG: CHAD domain-containing protein [Candidatus Omnitrophota bacterium]
MNTADHREHVQAVILPQLDAFARQKAGVRRGKDIEPLHQARILTRKLRNSLRTFRDIFPRKKLKRWDNSLGQFAAAAGEGRDLDILIEFLHDSLRRLKDPCLREGSLRVLKDLQKRRQRVQPKIIRALSRLNKDAVARSIQRSLVQICLAAPRKKTGRIFKTAKRDISAGIKGLSRRQACVRRLGNVHSLHRMRIRAKYLRYTLEACENFYGRRIRPYIVMIRTIQGSLGEFHDSFVWSQILSDLGVRRKKDRTYSAAIKYLTDRCRVRQSQAYRSFIQYWLSCEKKNKWSQLERIISLPKD